MTDKWIRRYLKHARDVATWSKDFSTQVGAVIVRPDNTPFMTGFNGFPKKLRDLPEFYEDRGVKYSRTIHAEMNAFIHARGDVTGCMLLTWPLAPCDRCVVHLIEAGIIEFIFPRLAPELAARWGQSTQLSKDYITEAGLRFQEVEP